jgi:hypothetical protein
MVCPQGINQYEKDIFPGFNTLWGRALEKKYSAKKHDEN